MVDVRLDSYGFEQYLRQTIPGSLAEEPALLYDACVLASFTAHSLAHHYDNKLVTTVAPVWDNGSNSEFNDPKLKLLSAGNWKPFKEASEDDEYPRVCSEQNFIDNALRIGDTLLGVLFIRATNNVSGIEGVSSPDIFCMCFKCRGRASYFLGSKTLAVFLRGDNLEPTEALTIEQQINEHDFGYDHEVMATGKEVKDLVVETFRDGSRAKVISKLPPVPSRKYRRRTDE